VKTVTRRPIVYAAVAALLLGVCLAGAVGGYFALSSPAAPVLPPFVPPSPGEEAAEAPVRELCGACHSFPPPDSFPRGEWRKQVQQGFNFFQDSDLRIDYPSIEGVCLFYEHRAPEELPPLRPGSLSDAPPVRFGRTGVPLPDRTAFPAVANVNLVHLTDPRKLDLLACDQRSGQVLLLKPYEESPSWQVLATLPSPCHAEVVDLDGDGKLDLVVACLGEFYPTDGRVGSVVWLRGKGDGTFTPVTLLDGVGRVADVQVADFDGDGKLDLVVAVFGWRKTGEVTLLRNKTTDWARPLFEPEVLDPRHGAIHVPVADLNGDGKPDFVALISQEHETVVAFLNEGGGKFRKETIFRGPHPAYGSSGIQLVDLDGDGKLDVLYTNGDILDPPHLPRPDHGVRWLQNQGAYPFTEHLLAPMYGVHRAVAADFRGAGRLDVLAVSFLPPEKVPARAKVSFDSVVLLEQVSPGEFVRHGLEVGRPDHVTCVAGDWDGDGKVHAAVGNFFLSQSFASGDAVQLWKNPGPARGK
jgi:FG-GAP-like repeat